VINTHPNPDKRYVMVAYRQYLLGFKKKNGNCRSLVHYKDFVSIYKECKRIILQEDAVK
jgi:hypothetical protein